AGRMQRLCRRDAAQVPREQGVSHCRQRRSTMRWAILAFAGLLLAGADSAAQRPDRNVALPIVRSFNWFSYVAGDDIRARCGVDGRDRVRLVYNAIYSEQVRTYELFLQPDGTAGMTVGVLADQGDLSELSISEPGDI